MIIFPKKQQEPSLADTFALQLGQNLLTSEKSLWPDVYINSETKKAYQPHNEDEVRFVYDDFPKYALCKGGEGSGKTVAGIIKVLNRLRRGMSGALISHNLPHFKKSLWPEFRRWCPWNAVVEKHRYRSAVEYEPKSSFQLVFISELGTKVTLYCGGMGDGTTWEGPNLSFVQLDEAQNMKDSTGFSILSGRIRMDGPEGEPPQLFLTTVPSMNWLYDYFGPMKNNDPFEKFKKDSLVVTLRTEDNISNLSSNYIEDRASVLTDQERRRRLEAEWVDISNESRFLLNMQLWDRLQKRIEPLKGRDELIIALDGAVSGDSFAIVGVTRDREDPDNSVVIRYAQEWIPPRGRQIDFIGSKEYPGPELELRRLCKDYNVIQVVYDPYQLVSMVQRLTREQVAWFVPFEQGSKRAKADKQLLDLIVQKRIFHDGDEALRRHIDNADKKYTANGERLRLIKRTHSLKIDLAVCTSMASYACLYLNL